MTSQILPLEYALMLLNSPLASDDDRRWAARVSKDYIHPKYTAKLLEGGPHKGFIVIRDGRPPEVRPINEVEKLKDTGCFVYAVGGQGPLKIGHAQCPERRLSTLQTGSPAPLRILHKHFCESKPAAKRLERSLHDRFRHLRERGEWYDVPLKDLVRGIRELDR